MNLIEHGEESITQEDRCNISSRYKAVTKAINQKFYDSDSEVRHSLYVGSYGRGTAINTSDIDIMVILPEEEYLRYDDYLENGQSCLLQAVRNAVRNKYPRSDIRADGQVVKINFSDGIRFEILPAFEAATYSGVVYKYPDSNAGGRWLSTNPKAEQEAMLRKNKISKGLLFDTCKHLRRIRDNYFSSYHLSGIVIDSFTYEAIGNWGWSDSQSNSDYAQEAYAKRLLDCIKSYGGSCYLNAPGSGDRVSMESSRECLEKVLKKLAE